MIPIEHQPPGYWATNLYTNPRKRPKSDAPIKDLPPRAAQRFKQAREGIRALKHVTEQVVFMGTAWKWVWMYEVGGRKLAYLHPMEPYVGPVRRQAYMPAPASHSARNRYIRDRAPVMTKRCGRAAVGVALACVIVATAAAQTGQPAPAIHAPVIGDTGKLAGPRQPIFFRHDVHAGQYQIPCLYCHATVTVSSEPGLPTVT